MTENVVTSPEVAEKLGPPFYFDTRTEKLCGALAYCWLNSLEFPDEWGNKQDEVKLHPTLRQFAQQLRFSRNDSSGSANHYIAKSSCKLLIGCLSNDKIAVKAAVDAINYYFTSQKVNGHLWFSDKDETTSPGYTKLHVAFVALARMVNNAFNIDTSIEDFSLDWLLSQNALFKIFTANNGHIYMPGKRSQPYGKLQEGNIFECKYNRELDNLHSLLSTNTDREDTSFYDIFNGIGHPANIASYIVKEMIMREMYYGRIPNLEEDLPFLGHPLNVLRTDEGYIAYYERVNGTIIGQDWMHWSVRYLNNHKTALEIAEKNYQDNPPQEFPITDGAVKLRVFIDRNNRIITEN